MQAVKERVDTLERVLQEYISQSNAMMARMEADTRALKEDTLAFKDEMRLHREDTKASADRVQAAVEKMEADTLAFKDEMREQHRERNREWAGVAKKLGTIVEDLIAPAVRPALKKYFGVDPQFMAIRPRKRVAAEEYEVDVLSLCEQVVFLVEAKTSLRPEHVDQLLEKVLLFERFFPEYAGRRAIPILATIVFPPEILTYATRKRVYAMAFREWEYMDILNYEEIGG